MTRLARVPKSPKRAYGWRGEVPDIRDYALHVTPPTLAVPRAVDLRDLADVPIGDQGQLGSCTAFAALAAYRFVAIRSRVRDFDPSELFEYYETRAAEGTTKSDAGASIRDAIKTIAKKGVCPEKDWPYDIKRFAVRPSPEAVKAARVHAQIVYQQVPQSITAVKAVLAAGHPVVIGIGVYRSYEGVQATENGVVPMPIPGEDFLGGHAIALWGYNEATELVLVHHSWGEQDGDKGYRYLPFSYVSDARLASDFWTITLAS